MATVSKGRTFVSGETVTPTKLNELVDNATVTAIQTTDISDSQITTAKIADANVTAAKLNGAQTGSAPIYGCRAWVNFNGLANANLSATYSQSGTTITVTATAHNLKVGHSVYLDFTTGNATDIWATVVTVVDANTFTVTGVTNETTSGAATLLRQQIRASGNVSTVVRVGNGRYVVNFDVSMDDANYALVVGGPSLAYGNSPFVIQEQTGTGVRTKDYISIYVHQGGTSSDEDVVNVAVFR